jgi:hypothetical protein
VPRSKSKAAKPFTGVLAEPIRSTVLTFRPGETHEAFKRRWATDVNAQTEAKLPLLARHFWPNMPAWDPKDPHEAVAVYARLATELAAQRKFRSFLPARVEKYPRFLILKALEFVDGSKAADAADGKPARSDFQIILPHLRMIDQEAVSLSDGELRSCCRTWCKQLTALRASLRRQRENKIN